MKISVKVCAHSGKNEVIEKASNSFVVHTTKAPQKGEANKDVVKLLAKHFHIAQGRISILRGSRSRTKLVQVDV